MTTGAAVTTDPVEVYDRVIVLPPRTMVLADVGRVIVLLPTMMVLADGVRVTVDPETVSMGPAGTAVLLMAVVAAPEFVLTVCGPIVSIVEVEVGATEGAVAFGPGPIDATGTNNEGETVLVNDTPDVKDDTAGLELERPGDPTETNDEEERVLVDDTPDAKDDTTGLELESPGDVDEGSMGATTLGEMDDCVELAVDEL